MEGKHLRMLKSNYASLVPRLPRQFEWQSGHETVLYGYKQNMAVTATEVIVPSLSELAIQEDVLCPVEGCNKRFKSSACLSMHKVRHHDGLTMTSVAPGNQSSKRNKLYYCPVEDCNRSQKNNGKPFPRIGQLKQVCII